MEDNAAKEKKCIAVIAASSGDECAANDDRTSTDPGWPGELGKERMLTWILILESSCYRFCFP